MKNNKHIQSFNEHGENLIISDVRSSSFDDVLKEYGRDEIIRVVYLWTPFRRSSGDLEKMTNDELKFYWEQVVKNYYF